MTTACLTAIGTAGGPRCCRRDSYLALQGGRELLNNHLGAGLPTGRQPDCIFMASNKECLGADCLFSPAGEEVDRSSGHSAFWFCPNLQDIRYRLADRLT